MQRLAITTAFAFTYALPVHAGGFSFDLPHLIWPSPAETQTTTRATSGAGSATKVAQTDLEAKK